MSVADEPEPGEVFNELIANLDANGVTESSAAIVLTTPDGGVISTTFPRTPVERAALVDELERVAGELREQHRQTRDGEVA